MSASRHANIDNLRHEKLEGMPVRFTYRNYEGTGEQIVLLKHPLCASKCFSVKEHGTFEAAKGAALAFHAELEASGSAYEPSKPTRRTEELPKGMYCKGNGYGYSKTIRKDDLPEAVRFLESLPRKKTGDSPSSTSTPCWRSMGSLREKPEGPRHRSKLDSTVREEFND